MKIRILKVPKWHNDMASQEAQRAKEAFEALSPEEQTAVMQQVAAQEQAAMQQQAVAEQQMQGVPVEQPAPEELMQQSTVQADGSPAALGQEAPVMAYGGKINKFDNGGIANIQRWFKEKYPGYNDNSSRIYATAIYNYLKKKYSSVPISNDHYETAWTKLKLLRNENGFNKLVGYGIPKNVAFGIAFPSVEGAADPQEALKNRERAYYRLVKGQNQVSTTVKPSAVLEQPTQNSPQFLYGYNGFVPTAMTDAIIPEQSASVQEVPIAATSEIDDATSAPAPATDTSDAFSPSVAPVNSVTGRPYDWYRNGSDGYSTPTGFTVGENGLIDKENGYTQEYRDLVGKLTADDIRKWAAEHPQDPSLLSFLAKGNKLEDLTTEQWRKGALDGKYGFMHHVGNQILNTPSSDGTLSEEALAAVGRPAQVFHAMDGDDYDGYIEGALGPEVGDETRRETLPNGDVVIYHKRKDVASSTNVTEPSATDTSGDLEPVHRSEFPRYMGLMGPAVGLGMMAAGVGKPDMSEMDRIVANSARTYHTAANKYLGNYMRYQPLDIWFQQAKLDAQSRAADRSVLNSGANQGSKMAGILANGLNSQIASGNLFRQAQEYNDAMRKQVADFNRGTDQFNAEAFNRLSQFNASEANRANQFNSHLAMQAAREKEAARAGWYNSLYGNVNQMFKGMSDLGTENARNNMVNWALAKGLFGTVNPDDEFLKGRVRRKQS